ncbi:DNA-binding transcriptional regulator, AcrR family [Arthrobacter alpinus]|uniref:DNA-binding transcriptional regulator, AcrR family n=1 Tax=Arthrobacter alpinus TaxID=656366 RepID=A0A1H5IP92_9MICC|nr:TetR/AcrR family transcriptional regulator [Arthrobacter alpinus]SEE41288.1 DNA-binding transcriptional regulator, AcrR family [Arthrobacter alpinus]
MPLTPSLTNHTPARQSADEGNAVVPAQAQAEPDLASARDRQLHQAAHELFSSKGLGVPLADVAKAAGIGVATLYRRYRDKDVLILDVYREHMAYAEKLSVEANEYPEAWEGLVYFLSRSTDQFMADRGMRELILGGYVGGVGWARGSSHRELIQALDTLERRVTKQLEQLVDRAKVQHTVRSDFEPTDVLLMSAMANAAAPVKESGWPVTGQRALQLLIEGIRPPK